MKGFKNQQGFTLIELVIVIVILGILAATAAPKFIDLTGDAKKAVVEAVKGSINSATDMAHAKALVSNHVDGYLSIAGENINFVKSWPATDSINDLLDLDADSDIAEVSGSKGTFQYSSAVTPAKCQVVYTQTTDANSKPSIDMDITDC